MIDQIDHLIGILRSGVGIVISVGTAEPIRKPGMMNSNAVQKRLLPSVQTGQAHRLIGHPVIPVAQRDEIEVSRVQPRHQHGEFVGLTPRAGEVADF